MLGLTLSTTTDYQSSVCFYVFSKCKTTQHLTFPPLKVQWLSSPFQNLFSTLYFLFDCHIHGVVVIFSEVLLLKCFYNELFLSCSVHQSHSDSGCYFCNTYQAFFFSFLSFLQPQLLCFPPLNIVHGFQP